MAFSYYKCTTSHLTTRLDVTIIVCLHVVLKTLLTFSKTMRNPGIDTLAFKRRSLGATKSCTSLLKVRGAPAIAIVGCLSLAVEMRDEVFETKKVLRQELEGKLNYLVSSRPTAVNMKMAADQLISLANELYTDECVSVEDMKSR